MSSKIIYDCLIIGGGAAGLSAALALGRVSRSCALFSNHKHRNSGIKHIHAVLGADHISPETFYSAGKQQIARYQNTEFFSTEIATISRSSSASPHSIFTAKTTSGECFHGRTVVLATGVRDVHPDLEGYSENWPSNIYQCLFCDGYERREMAKGILCYPSFKATDAKIASMAHFLSPSSHSGASAGSSPVRSKVTVFTNGPPNPTSDPDISKALNTCAAHGIYIDARPVLKLVADPDKEGLYIHLQDSDDSSSAVHVGFLHHKPPIEMAASHLISQLEIECSSPGGLVNVNSPMQSTNVPGVFVAGDTCTDVTHVTKAMNTGMMCAAGVAHYCNELDDQIVLARGV